MPDKSNVVNVSNIKNAMDIMHFPCILPFSLPFAGLNYVILLLGSGFIQTDKPLLALHHSSPGGYLADLHSQGHYNAL